MDALLLARIQFGFTISFHIVFPSLTIGLASYLAVLEGLWLRTGRQAVSDPAAFRHFILEGLKTADGEARRQGYAAEDIKLAIFAVVAFLDESVLNREASFEALSPSRAPMYSWSITPARNNSIAARPPTEPVAPSTRTFMS